MILNVEDLALRERIRHTKGVAIKKTIELEVNGIEKIRHCTKCVIRFDDRDIGASQLVVVCCREVGLV